MSGDRLQQLFDDGEGRDEGKPFGWMGLLDGLKQSLKRTTRYNCPDGDAQGELQAALEEAQEKFHDQIKVAFERGLSKCESPIEMALLPWLVAQEYRCFRYSPTVLFPGEQEQLPEATVAIVPQLPIGRSRVDFALAARRGGPVRFVIIECDGAEFHDSVADVKKDLNRDVKILANPRVLEIVRLSGKEIMRSPRDAAWKTSRELTHAWAKTNKNMDEKFGVVRDE